MMTSHLKHYEPLVQKLFEALELSDAQELALIHPETKKVENPAIAHIADFLKSADKLIICGDYDCDGIASTSLTVLLARKLGLDPGYYIPDRFKEGYGVNVNTIDAAHKKGYTDVLIIDNGVKAHVEIERAQSYGMRVAVVDHHIIEEPLPIEAFLHPDVCEPYAASMCATGLMYCVAETMGLADDYMLSLAALATVADVMPLWGKNREIVRRGSKALNENQFKQFDKIVKRNQYTHYSAKLLAFQLVPKINSVGRMADVANVNTVVQYFTTADDAIINSYSKQLLKLNDFRKEKGKQLQAVAMEKVTDDAIQIITDASFHEGLLGIVANQVASVTQKPTLVLTEYETTFKGSGRSMTHSLQDIFSSINRDYFEAMGGHDFAFGMTIKKEFYAQFVTDVRAVVDTLPPFVQTDTAIVSVDPEDVTHKAMRQLTDFEPYGEAFKLPKVKIPLPTVYGLVNLNGYGFKFTFSDYPIQEAVFFTKQYTRNQLVGRTYMIGELDLSNTRKLSILIEDII
ncbi:single-stranded-DNA-specific exonuclease RecJ [Erysipelothrix anatis]|uniref:single-stranded-DNA-specific exonuclease RecJ n=1 Tax=Erysipelothrix anatis TaxID=2683713 RepID=UPI001F42374C|nr:DHH family phosphoesterase [Erysipelothrix anatis]